MLRASDEAHILNDKFFVMEFRFSTGSSFAGYTLDAPLGAGCAGETYRARRAGAHVNVALKIAWPHLAAGPGFAFAMQRQIRILQKIRGARLAIIMDTGISKGLPFIASEFITGPGGIPLSLRDVQAEVLGKDRQLDEDIVFKIGKSLADKLGAIHAFRDAKECPDGIALGDLRPTNVLFDADKRIHLCDAGFGVLALGVARAADCAAPAVETCGISPEVLAGGKPTVRSDVYSFGALLYELLTGQKYSADAKPCAEIRKSIRPGWAAVLSRCLAKNPDERFADTASLKTFIENVEQTPRPTIAISEDRVVPAVAATQEKQAVPAPVATPVIPQSLTADLPKTTSVPKESAVAWKSPPAVRSAKLKTGGPKLPPPKSPPPKIAPVKTDLKPPVAKAAETGIVAAPVTATPAGPPVAAKRKYILPMITSGILIVAIIVLLVIAHFSRKDKGRTAAQFPAPTAAAAPAQRVAPVQTITPQAQPQGLSPVADADSAAQSAAAAAAKPTPPESQTAPQPVAPQAAAKSTVAAAAPAEEKPWKVADLGITMKWIPPGKALVGSEAEERTAAGKFMPTKEEHVLTYEDVKEENIAAGFWLGETEVTIGQWKQFIAANKGYKTAVEKKGGALSIKADGSLAVTPGTNWRLPIPGESPADDHPVTCVSPADAEAFCAWLTKREREAGLLSEVFAFRLPTELEWDYACRGGATSRTAFWWGADPAGGEGRLNAAGSEFAEKFSATKPYSFAWNDSFVHASPVGSFGEKGRNGFGLSDMLGNVWECVTKPFVSKYTYAWRGGSFADGPGIVRCASARHRYTESPSCTAGFRLCFARTNAQ